MCNLRPFFLSGQDPNGFCLAVMYALEAALVLPVRASYK